MAVAAFIVAVGVFVKNYQNIKIPGSTAQKVVQIGSIKINVEIADTPEARERGLSERSSLKEGDGMLFVFPSQNTSPLFWMKGMLIPIDIIWINDLRVVKIDKAIEVPSAGTPDNGLKTYSADSPVDYVLEVAGGFCDKKGIKVGDSVQVP